MKARHGNSYSLIITEDFRELPPSDISAHISRWQHPHPPPRTPQCPPFSTTVSSLFSPHKPTFSPTPCVAWASIAGCQGRAVSSQVPTRHVSGTESGRTAGQLAAVSHTGPRTKAPSLPRVLRERETIPTRPAVTQDCYLTLLITSRPTSSPPSPTDFSSADRNDPSPSRPDPLRAGRTRGAGNFAK